MGQHLMFVKIMKDKLMIQSLLVQDLDYPGVSPIHCFLKDTKRARYTYATDEDALNASVMVTKYENLNPSLRTKSCFCRSN